MDSLRLDSFDVLAAFYDPLKQNELREKNIYFDFELHKFPWSLATNVN